MIRPRKLVGSLVFITGCLLLLILSLPMLVSIIHFSLFSSPKLIDPTAVTPFRSPAVVNIFGIAVTDDTNPQSWFSSSIPASASANNPVKYYYLTIPRLKMDRVQVEINGLDLKKNAVHYPGTALPGSFGNTVIFGHSALPFFYKPGQPLTIFNPLPDIKIGDEVTIDYNSFTYRYIISHTAEVTPDQVSVLAQSPDRHRLTLITCVPLGTFWHRFVATADLAN